MLGMKIRSLGHAIPSRAVTNDDVIALLVERNQDHFSVSEIAELERRLKKGFKAAGTSVRYILDMDEKAVDLVREASGKALAKSGLTPADIDLVLYAGVGRGWIEPAMATIVQREIGAINATCFDILDACASWLRALQVAHKFIASGTYQNVMIVNCECGFFPDYAQLEFSSVDELDRYFATFTIGEAATATVLSGEDQDDDFYFNIKTFAEHCELCSIPLTNARQFAPVSTDSRYEFSKFYSLSSQLVSVTAKKLIEAFVNDPALQKGRYDICFSHSASEKAVGIGLRMLGIPREIYYPTNRKYGNTVAASIPLGMSLALEEGRLIRGQRVLIGVGSAGISIALASFTF